MSKTSVLVLGSTGMLGWIVDAHLRKNPDLNVIGTQRLSFDNSNGLFMNAEDDEPFMALKSTKFDYIINCIGIIKPYCKDQDPAGVQRAIRVNAHFPWILSNWASQIGTKVIQIATDCVYSGLKGQYTEVDPHDAHDVYGKTKSLGEVFDNSNFLNIRASIIGPEIKGKLSLLEWFLGQPDGSTVTGFTHHLWNGITTLQYAQLVEQIILLGAFEKLRNSNYVHHYSPNEVVTKYDLLKLMAEVYRKEIRIQATDAIGPKIDRTISSKFDSLNEIMGKLSIAKALKDTRDFRAPN